MLSDYIGYDAKRKKFYSLLNVQPLTSFPARRSLPLLNMRFLSLNMNVGRNVSAGT